MNPLQKITLAASVVAVLQVTAAITQIVVAVKGTRSLPLEVAE